MGALFSWMKSALLLAHLGEALAAINRTVGLGLKGDPSLAAAGSAGGSEVLTGATGRVLAGVTAGLAQNTIPGDLPSSNLEEIETIIKAHNQTGPQSEMAR